VSGEAEAGEQRRYEELWRAKGERDVAFLVAWLERFPDEGTLPARWLADWGEQAAVPSLIRMLSAGRVESRRSAARALGELGSPVEARAALEDVATNDPDSGARSWAYAALGKYRDPNLLPLLVAALNDDRWEVRNGAAVGLGELGDERAIEPLRTALRRIRFKPVAWYLGRSACKRALGILRQAHPGQ
jgi:HEAT repeat protein